MLKVKLYDGTEMDVFDGSSLFDLEVDPSKFEETWSLLNEKNLKIISLIDPDTGNTMDSLENLVVENEISVREKGEIHCHFYLRERDKMEILEEQIKTLTEKLAAYESR